MVMLETWVGEKRWRKVKEKLPRGYVWKCQLVERKNKKGGAMEVIIMRIR